MNESILREVTPMSDKDCFLIFKRVKEHFDFPLHIHREYELNLIENGKDAQRIVGDSIENIEDLELTLIANENLAHAWFDHDCESKEIRETTLQFHQNLLSDNILKKKQFASISEMLEKASCGVVFPRETILKVKDQFYDLATNPDGIYSVFIFFKILYDLSLSPMRELSSRSFVNQESDYDSRRIERVYTYMIENYDKDIKLGDVATLVGMTDTSFSRFIKKRTGRNFIDSLSEIRFSHATRLLIDTTNSISEICFSCGFNNLSNFNRIFKQRKQCTPREFRENYKKTKFYL